MTWSDGLGTTLTLAGRGRDLLTPEDGARPIVMSAQRVDVTVTPERKVARLAVHDCLDGDVREVTELVGLKAMSGFRTAVAERVPDLVEARTPLSLLVDDTPGATLISGFAFSRWTDVDLMLDVSRTQGHVRRMEGICTGFMPGSSGLAPDGTARWNHRTRRVRPLAEDPDPWAWHNVPTITEVSMRRMRRIDVWQEDGRLRIDAMFQDSSTTPDGGRDAVHEYSLAATAGLGSGELLEVLAVPRVLPYAECPLATLQVDRLVGVPLEGLRAAVLERLPGTAGCTHLNDALRALADVPHLATLLEPDNERPHQ
ncbi:DUF2889 domain-containing protein [Streptomyces sp. NPDC021080]|uniref:DUF2889 domain-containing protein n=1 Tax=Streptomyces sp. NPDC021080 TaxID=3365110 RepID=UPI00378B525E